MHFNDIYERHSFFLIANSEHIDNIEVYMFIDVFEYFFLCWNDHPHCEEETNSSILYSIEME